MEEEDAQHNPQNTYRLGIVDDELFVGASHCNTFCHGCHDFGAAFNQLRRAITGGRHGSNSPAQLQTTGVPITPEEGEHTLNSSLQNKQTNL